MKGTVKWFNTTKGYGFIASNEVEKDVFVHVSEVESSGYRSLHEDQQVSFDLKEDRGRNVAANIKVLD